MKNLEIFAHYWIEGERICHSVVRSNSPSSVMWFWSCEMFLIAIRELSDLFDVARDCCEWDGKWVGCRKWEFYMQIFFDITIPALQLSARFHTIRKQNEVAGAEWLSKHNHLVQVPSCCLELDCLDFCNMTILLAK